MLNFNTEIFDFWPIYETIKQFYPIGISTSNRNLFDSYPGTADLKKLVIENIHDKINFESRWKKFDELLEAKTKFKPVGTTMGQAPSFSSFIEIERIDHGSLTRVKRLHYFVSLLDSYYTVLGDDLSIIKVDDSNLHRINYLVASPFNEFAESFNKICVEIETHFKNFRYVPLFISKQCIDGLDVGYTDYYANSIFSALFNNTNLDIWTYGDDAFKAEIWLREGLTEMPKWSVQAPNNHDRPEKNP